MRFALRANFVGHACPEPGHKGCEQAAGHAGAASMGQPLLSCCRYRRGALARALLLARTTAGPRPGQPVPHRLPLPLSRVQPFSSLLQGSGQGRARVRRGGGYEGVWAWGTHARAAAQTGSQPVREQPTGSRCLAGGPPSWEASCHLPAGRSRRSPLPRRCTPPAPPRPWRTAWRAAWGLHQGKVHAKQGGRARGCGPREAFREPAVRAWLRHVRASCRRFSAPPAAPQRCSTPAGLPLQQRAQPAGQQPTHCQMASSGGGGEASYQPTAGWPAPAAAARPPPCRQLLTGHPGIDLRIEDLDCVVLHICHAPARHVEPVAKRGGAGAAAQLGHGRALRAWRRGGLGSQEERIEGGGRWWWWCSGQRSNAGA